MMALVISTYPDIESASEAAKRAVEGGFAACVSVLPVRSIYRWKGKTVRAGEYLALFKTAEEGMPELKRKIGEAHPYEVPEIAEIDVKSINAPYLEWLRESQSAKRR